ncbi:MAG: hypothetical protein Q8O38_06485 [Sulfurimicrobium sp.]|nr:hypothetical protein [Sulfurimicrobium sp.]
MFDPVFMSMSVGIFFLQCCLETFQSSCRRPDLAHQFINFMLEGENAAELANLIGAGSPNAAAIPYIKAEIAANPALFPHPQGVSPPGLAAKLLNPARQAGDAKKLEMLRDFDPRQRRMLSRMWTEIKLR